MAQTFQLRLGTFNTWHGLDHTRPRVMFPLEKRQARNARRKVLEDGLKKLVGDPLMDGNLSLMCLQELNPLDSRSAELKKALGCDLRTQEVNVGVRLGRFSYPFFLQEGLCSMWQGDLSRLQVHRWTLSGTAAEYKLFPMGLPLTLQTAERRGALALHFSIKTIRLLVVNMHLHHGSPNDGEDLRRLEELKLLLSNCAPLLDKVDAFFLVGDFNCEQGQQDYQYLLGEGFKELTVNEQKGEIKSWDPDHNPICKHSADTGGNAWDQSPRQFDHIFYKGAAQVEMLKPVETLFNGSNGLEICSDHFGLLCTMQITK